MFDNRKGLIDRPVNIREQKKLLPYTVVEVNYKPDLADWYIKRAEGSRIRLEKAKEAAVAMIMSDKTIPVETESAGTKAYNYQNKGLNAWLNPNSDNMFGTDRTPSQRFTAIEKPSIFSRIYNYCLNAFLNTKLN